jgi:hypothetical protein
VAGKKLSIEEIIKGKGYIREEFWNPIKKKKMKEYRITPEQKKEILKKQKIIQTVSKKKPRGWGIARYG